MEVSLLTEGQQQQQPTLETVRVLHETISALRSALEGSQKELIALRNRIQFSSQFENLPELRNDKEGFELSKKIGYIKPMDNEVSESDKKSEAESDSKTQEKFKIDSEAESDDIDDIELVFTTGETDPTSIHEDLVPIAEGNSKKFSSKIVVLETDISKCGILDESEAAFSGRRNTLPNPLPYQPIIHREIFASARKGPLRSPCKALLPGTQETSAQTDITALPAQWKSETFLAHKMNYNLTTLPSKFTLPVPQAKRLPLSDKTCEARRVLLSDINFTSMVPELSRSADHLHDEKDVTKKQTNAFEIIKSCKTKKCCEFSRQDSRSSCGSYYGGRYLTSSTSIPPLICEDTRRKHSWKSLYLCCCRSKQCIWSSVPSSLVRCSHEIHETSMENLCRLHFQKRKAKIHVHCCGHCQQSMPNLRVDVESEDSTDSLMDEAEEFLRRSVDSILISTNQCRRRERRFSEADSIFCFEPPKTAQPFLPKSIKDLPPDCFVKIITPQGKIVVGRVRYCGHVPEKTEPYVGVEVAGDSGLSDGTFMGHRFFQCEPAHALFVPFKKVVIAWSV